MNWKEKLKSSVTRKLPAQKAHLKMLPPGRSLTVPSENETVRKSSVLLLLFEQEGEIYACLTKRSSHLKYHPGQIGLPGGTVEKTDNSLVETALRETNEELGINAGQIEVIGMLSEVYVSVSRFLIYPFIGWSEGIPKIEINRREVEKLILFPVIKHLKIRNYELESVDTTIGQLKVPCIKYNEEIIWGATAMILSEFLDLLSEINANSD